MFYYISLILLFVYSFGYSQEDVFYSVNFSANGEIISETNNHVMYSSDTVQITKIRFYISNIRLLNEGKEVWKDDDIAHLIDVKNNSGFDLKKTSEVDYDEVKFDLGVDSLTNISGALAGALDPTKGMYWSWQSGYINFKMEGYKNNRATQEEFFQFHIGGYSSPFNAIQSFAFKVKNKNKFIDVIFDVELFLAELNFEKQKSVMRPCKESVQLAKFISNAVYIND